MQNTKRVFCRVSLRITQSIILTSYGTKEMNVFVERSTIKDECGRIRVWYSALDISRWMDREKGNDG